MKIGNYNLSIPAVAAMVATVVLIVVNLTMFGGSNTDLSLLATLVGGYAGINVTKLQTAVKVILENSEAIEAQLIEDLKGKLGCATDAKQDAAAEAQPADPMKKG